MSDHSDTQMHSPTPTLPSTGEARKQSSTSDRRESTLSHPASDLSTVSKTAPETKDKRAGPGEGGAQAPLEVSRPRFWAIFISLMFAIFLFALGEWNGLRICIR